MFHSRRSKLVLLTSQLTRRATAVLLSTSTSFCVSSNSSRCQTDFFTLIYLLLEPQNHMTFSVASTRQKREQKLLPPPRCLYSSRLSCLLPASVAAPIMIPLCIMTKRFFFYDLLLAGSLQHHLFLSPHEKISAVFCYCFFSCSSFFYTL